MRGVINDLISGGKKPFKKKNLIKNASCYFEHLSDGSLKFYNLVLCRKIAIQCAIEVV